MLKPKFHYANFVTKSATKSPKLHDFMICRRFCPRLSGFVSTTYPRKSFCESRHTGNGIWT